MKYAVIQTGGKQYRIAEGDILEVERLTVDKKDIEFSEVLLFHNDGAIKIGAPFVSGVSVKAKVLEDLRGEKIRVAKFKAKARYRRVTGHRQALTKIQIESIADQGSKKTEETTTKKKAVKTA